MRRLALVALVVLALAGVAFAEGDFGGITSSWTGTRVLAPVAVTAGSPSGVPTDGSAPQGLAVHGQDANPTDAETPAPLYLRGGNDEKTAVVADYSLCAGNYLRMTCGVTAYTCTEGVGWTAATSNTATATSLLACVDAIVDTCVDPLNTTSAVATVYVAPSVKSGGLIVLSTDDATCLTVTNGTAAPVYYSGTLRAVGPSGAFMIDGDGTSLSTPTLGPNIAFTGVGLGASGSTTLNLIGGGSACVQVRNTDTLVASACDFKPRGGLLSDTSALTVEDDLAITGALTKGATTNCTLATQSLTFATNPGDASKVTSGLVPDGAMLLGISTRVTTAATNCTSVNIGDGTDVDMFGATTAITLNTTTTNANATAQFGRSPANAAMEVTITAVGGNCFTGVWAVTAHYCTATAATSN